MSPLYLWKEPGKLEEASLARVTPPILVAPGSPDDSPVVNPQKIALHQCTICHKKFKKPMIIARHFNSAHSDLKEDSDTWREYSEEVFD